MRLRVLVPAVKVLRAHDLENCMFSDVFLLSFSAAASVKVWGYVVPVRHRHHLSVLHHALGARRVHLEHLIPAGRAAAAHAAGWRSAGLPVAPSDLAELGHAFTLPRTRLVKSPDRYLTGARSGKEERPTSAKDRVNTVRATRSA